MTWPTMSDYQEAIQNPNTCFADRELKNGTPILNKLGLPKPIAGGFACVYQMMCGSHHYAVRCFLTEQSDLEKRYKIISAYLRQINRPYMVSFEFISQGIYVNGHWFPILKMEWIDGEPLNIYLKTNLHEALKLETLAFNFIVLIEDLRKHLIAHGDLQHENILVSNEQLILIDYDGLYVPGLEAMPSNEYGHRNYQHPSRSQKDYGLTIDNFSVWVIYFSILALSMDPNLWDQCEAGDGSLIFRKEDYLDPKQSLAFKSFEQSTLATLQSYARQLKAILQIEDLSKIPVLNSRTFSGFIKSPSISSKGLPAWLDDIIQATSPNSIETVTGKPSIIFDYISVNIAKKLESFKLKLVVFFKLRYIQQTKNLNNNLESFILEDSSVPGIGSQLIISLNKAGIRTAADILNVHIVKNFKNSPKAVALIEVSGRGKIRIEGIGPIKARALLKWKNHLETKSKKPRLLQTSKLLKAIKTKLLMNLTPDRK